MIREGVKHSARVNALSERAENLFYRLITTVDDAGRYYAEPALIKAACWPLKSIRLSDVALALDQLERAGLVARYAGKDGTRLLCLLRFRQTLKYPRPRFAPPPFDVETGEVRLFADDPPPPPKPEPRPPASEKRREEKRGEEAAPPPRPPAPTYSEWLARTRAANPGIDIDTEVRKATAVRSAQRKKFDTGWFERHWLPNCGQTFTQAEMMQAPSAAVADTPEIPGWREMLAGTSYGPGGRFEVTSWTQVAADRDVLAYVGAEAERRRKAA
jgi:hypothetical protein